ncbi:Prismane-like protein [Scenedesmus sp. NREL 46B-D3]|nr:Prismane-like protein [Scenedesmus sp. NREL 46B-D3]
MGPVIEPHLSLLGRSRSQHSSSSVSATCGSTDGSSSISSWESAAASIEGSAGSSSSTSTSSGGLLQTLLEPVEIVEPTFRQMLVVYRKKPRPEWWRGAWFKLTGQKVAPVARRSSIQLQHACHMAAALIIPSAVHNTCHSFELQQLDAWPSATRHVLVYRDIPLPSWQVVFPDKLLQFRPLDLLRLDLFGLAGAAAVLAQARYSSLVLELVTMVSLSVWGTRLVLGYLRMGDRYKSIVAQLLAERTVAGGEGGLEYLATAAGLQQFKQAALARHLFLDHELWLWPHVWQRQAMPVPSPHVWQRQAMRNGMQLCRMPARQHVSVRVAEMTRPTRQDDEAMFCYQVAILQDLLIYQLKGLGAWANFAHQTTNLGTPEVDSFVKAAIFATLTNVNFNPQRFVEYITKADDYLELIRSKLAQAGVQGRPTAAQLPWFDLQGNPMDFSLRRAMQGQPIDADTLEKLGEQVSLLHRREVMGEANSTLLGLHELLTYGLKGVAAYAHHAEMLGKVDASLDNTFEECSGCPLSALQRSFAFGQLGACVPGERGVRLPRCRAGHVHAPGRGELQVMALLDNAHTSRFGHPTPTQVRITPIKGKAILISGHDMHDLDDLLRQTEGTGINVYTHGEMLPGHGYPGLHKYKHLAGNYGGAWYRQKKDFAEFPGAILMTTNCIMDPSPTYSDRIFTTGEVGVAASKHLPGTPGAKDFSAVIKRAQELPGFTHEPKPKMVTVGFAHEATLGAAAAVLDAIKAGELSHIFLIGGCDAPEPSRRYYTDVVKGLPQDTMVLTLGCGKYRFYDQELGTLANGLPRLLDMGQCNDAYSALVVATELAKALDTDVNSLPLSLDISWFEQKAVAVLLTLLNLGVKNIRLGPQLPAFCTPDMIDLLVKTFDLKAADTKHPDEEIKRMMANA